MTTKIGSGATPRGGAESYLASRQTYAFVRSQNIYDRRFDVDALAFISDDQAHALRGVLLQPGDVLLNITGDGVTFGRTAIVDESALPACVNQHVSIIRADQTKVAPGYLLAYLTHPDVKRYVASFNSGGSRRAITKGHIESFQVPLPPIDVQRTIATTLRALDDKIESNRRAIAVATDLLDALAQKSAESLPPVPLSSIATLAKQPLNPATLGDEVVAHFSLPAFDVDARPEMSSASTIMSNKLIVPGPSILLSRLNPRIDRTWWAIPPEGVTALSSTEFAVLTAVSDLDLAALWLAVRDPYFRDEVPRRVTGTSGSHQRVRPEDLLAVEVPDVRELDTPVKELALGLLSTTHQKRQEASRLARLRDSLLPELLSGRIRAAEAAEVA